MITEAILNVFQFLIQGILFLLPNLPQMPGNIAGAMDSIVNTIGGTVGIISYIYTPPVFIFIFTFIVAILSFDSIYKLALWVLHKIRG